MLDALTTEKRNKTTMNLDTYSVKEIINKMNQEDEQVAKAVKSELDSITELVEAVIQSQKKAVVYFISALERVVD